MYLRPPYIPAMAGPEVEEARRIAEKGKPILGEHSKLEVIIEENMTFKVHTRHVY